MAQDYIWKEQRISAHMVAALERYAAYGEIPGGFLQAVIRNQLVEAYQTADGTNVRNMEAFAAYAYNELPADSRGSYAAMVAWNAAGGRIGLEKKSG